MRHDGRLAAALIILAACGSHARDPGPALQITGESTKVRRGDPLPATSPFFDGDRVTLRAIRGEVLGIVVWLREPAQVSLAIDGAATQGYRVTYQHVARPSTRMYGPSAGRGDWPDRLERVDGPIAADGAAFFEIVGKSAGAYDGTLSVGERRIPVSLGVDDITMPKVGTPRVWAYFDPREVDDPIRFARRMRPFGVVAMPDLGVDDWDTWAPIAAGMPWVPVRLPDDPAESDAAVRTWVARLDGTGQQPFAIPIDEPRTLAAKLAVRARARAVRAAGAGKFLYAVTDTPSGLYGDLVDLYVSPFARGGWTYNGTPPYAGSMILDTDGAALRTWGWIGWRWNVALWYVWDAAYFHDRHNAGAALDAERDAVSFDDGEDHGNLDGVLAYPDGASLRLMALRRGLEDRALLEMLERCAGRDAADAIARELVPAALYDAGPPGQSRPGEWPRDEAAWEAARLRLLEAIRAARCR